MNDPRIPGWQPGKMVAKLQNNPNQKNPILFRISDIGGHGSSSIEDYITQSADVLAFFWSNLKGK